ncbi:MAG: helix-turn-helix transcriptional regulator [Candidatus Nanoarchaeia archaeon]
MRQKQIGSILIAIGLILAGFVYMTKIREDQHIETMIQIQQGSCYLADGTCLHDDRDTSIYIFGYALSIALIILGAYIGFIDKTQHILEKHTKEVSHALKEAKRYEKEKDEFGAFLQGFSEEEQKILRAVKEQEGILQSTLRYKTGISKTSLSLILKSLEERKIVTRKESGKTNKVYLRNK